MLSVLRVLAGMVPLYVWVPGHAVSRTGRTIFHLFPVVTTFPQPPFLFLTEEEAEAFEVMCEPKSGSQSKGLEGLRWARARSSLFPTGHFCNPREERTGVILELRPWTIALTLCPESCSLPHAQSDFRCVTLWASQRAVDPSFSLPPAALSPDLLALSLWFLRGTGPPFGLSPRGRLAG